MEKKDSATSEMVIPTTCSSHCGGTCLLKVHTRDGVVTRIETDDGEEPQYRACLKGRAQRQRMYAPDRIMHPLRRVGERGEGKFEQISWDEALDTVARELKRVRDTYGPSALVCKFSGGDIGLLHCFQPMHRLFCMAGGYSAFWGSYSFEGAVFAELATYGTTATASTRDNLLHSRLIVLWGCNPAVTVYHANTSYYLAQARERGARIISVDPRYTESTAMFADQWIPIRPGTDAAMLIAMACVIIRDGLQDQKFLDRYTVGFDRFKDYVTGKEDGVAKTPAWAEAITGVPAATIETLAREYATTKPAALMAGLAAGRTAYGEQYHRAAITLSAMTGNIGVRGGDASGKAWGGVTGVYPFMKSGVGFAISGNPVEDQAPPRKDVLGGGSSVIFRAGRVNNSKMADALLKGKSGGYPADYKFLYLVNFNYPNQLPDANKSAQALKKLEFVVVQEQFMSTAAKFADIVLPTTTVLERNDIMIGAGTGFYGAVNKAVEPPEECKSHAEIAALLADRLGISGFTQHPSEDAWLRKIAADHEIPDYIEFRRTGSHKLRRTEPFPAFHQQIEDPQRHPFPTPSGKIEIYSERLADMDNPAIPPIPKYIETWESRGDPLAKKYPLQLVTSHLLRRAHSQFDNIPWARELQTQAVAISPADAESRGIRDGDMVRVFNDRGEMVIPARVTGRIMPGVVDVPQGAWYQPDDKGIDRGGCANTLTRGEPSPGGALASNTALVQVQRA